MFLSALKIAHLRFIECPSKPLPLVAQSTKASVPVWSSLTAAVGLLRSILICSCNEDVTRYPMFIDALVTGSGPVVVFFSAEGTEESGCLVLGLAELVPEGARTAKVATWEEFSSGSVLLENLDVLAVSSPRSAYVHQVRAFRSFLPASVA